MKLSPFTTAGTFLDYPMASCTATTGFEMFLNWQTLFRGCGYFQQFLDVHRALDSVTAYNSYSTLLSSISKWYSCVLATVDI
jgi:hypothetical protein